MASNELLHDPLLTSVPLTAGYKVLGGVALYQKLGQGGMGAVYKGRHVRLDIDVALKVMVPPAGISPELRGHGCARRRLMLVRSSFSPLKFCK